MDKIDEMGLKILYLSQRYLFFGRNLRLSPPLFYGGNYFADFGGILYPPVYGKNLKIVFDRLP